MTTQGMHAGWPDALPSVSTPCPRSSARRSGAHIFGPGQRCRSRWLRTRRSGDISRSSIGLPTWKGGPASCSRTASNAFGTRSISSTAPSPSSGRWTGGHSLRRLAMFRLGWALLLLMKILVWMVWEAARGRSALRRLRVRLGTWCGSPATLWLLSTCSRPRESGELWAALETDGKPFYPWSISMFLQQHLEDYR